MAFYYLSSEEIRELVTAAKDSRLILKQRELLFQFIDPGYWGTLNQDPAPLEQFRADLGSLNRVERVEDNTVPLAIYLDNAADLIDPLPEAKIFRKYQNKVQNRATGTTSVATLASLPATVITKQAIIHQDDTVTRAYLELCLKIARSVAKLVTPRFDSDRQYFVNGRPWLFNGTGWLIASDLIITNHHVVNSRSGDAIAAPDDFNRQAREMLVYFDFDSDSATLDRQSIECVKAADPTWTTAFCG
jgi:endonuclease G